MPHWIIHVINAMRVIIIITFTFFLLLFDRVKDCGPFGEDDITKIISDVKEVVSSSIMEELGAQVQEMSASLLRVFHEIYG